MVGADSGRRVGVQLLADDARSVTVDVRGTRQTELGQLALVARYHPWEIHHLRQPEYAAPPEEALQVAFVECSKRRLEA